ncbi:Synaptojanin-1, partial [Pseudolycoriella hygida]
MDKDELREQLKTGDIDPVLEHDQLNEQKSQGNVFNEFNEGPITFPPTYKYDLFSDDYDTSEKCRAPAWTDRVLWRRRQSHPDANKSVDWNQGKLIHYGRSELKQSDHRPVIAIIDIEIFQIDQDLRQRVFGEVIQFLGPPDATIVIHAEHSSNHDDDEESSIYDEDVMAALLQELTKFGEVTLVRYVGETMWITFRDGQSALSAVNKRSVSVCGTTLHFKLKTENWLEEVQREIALCTTNTVPLCDYTPTAQPSAYNCLGIPKVPPQRPKSPQRPSPPTRPPLPKSSNPSPNPSPKHVPKAGVISVIPDMMSRMNIEATLPTQPIAPAVDQSSAIYEEINDDNF